MDNSENIFVKLEQEHAKRAVRLGIDDLDVFGQERVRWQAEERIREENITDEAEKRKVYDDIKQQYKEYMAKEEKVLRPRTPVKELSALSENIFARRDQERDQERVEHAIRWGYDDLDELGQGEVRWTAERLIRKEEIIDEAEKREVYERVKAQYLEYSADRNQECDKLLATFESKMESNPVLQEQQSETVLLREEMKQLREEVKKLNERLGKLEKYTQE